MKTLSYIRNIGIVAHIDSGKTTLTERILYYTGVNHKVGEVHHGTTTMDHTKQERERGITITAAATQCEWLGHGISIIDTPGHVDFTMEVSRSLRVLDGLVFLFSAVDGVEPQSETNWRLANEQGLSRLAFVNKMDRVGADFNAVVNDIREKLNGNAIPVQLPIGAEDHFEGIIDLVNMQAIWHFGEMGSERRRGDIPAEYREIASTAHARLLEALCEVDMNLLEKYIERQTITPADILLALRKGCVGRRIVPVLCGSAFKNKGVQNLLDSIVELLPSPADTGNSVEKPFAALAFKVVTNRHGKLTYLRIYNGELKTGDTVLNSVTGELERLSAVYQMHANSKTAKAYAYAGEIVAVSGLKETRTGHTLCHPQHPVVLESMDFPEPVIAVAIEPKTQQDYVKLGYALARLAEEDPTFVVQNDAELGQTLICGMGELHLDIKIDLLKTDYQVEVNKGQPKVAYKERLQKTVIHREVFRKQNGGSGSFADIYVEIGPGDETAEGLQFVNEISGGNIPKEFIPAVEKGFRNCLSKGQYGYPLQNLKVRLLDGSTHSEDSDALSFELCAREAFRNVLETCQPYLLEPVMDARISVPDAYTGAVISDLNKRSGIITDLVDKDHLKYIHARVPASKMFGYMTSLRTITSGRGNFSMQFSGYQKAM